MTDEAEIWKRYSDGCAALVDLFATTSIDLDEVTRAEGLRHLTRILHMAMFTVHDYADTADPSIFLAKTPAMLSGGVTSDCVYHEGFIDPSRTYRLTGTRGTAELLEVTTYQGRLGLADRADVVDSLLEDALVVDANGRFEILLGPGARPAGHVGNWLSTDDATRGRATWLLLREYSPRVECIEPARFAIEPIDGATLRPSLNLAAIDDVLTRNLEFARRQLTHFLTSATNIIQHFENRFIIVDENRDAGGALPSGHRFAAGGFRLAPDEAWVVTIPGIAAAPYDVAPYWGFQLCNFWYEPFDYGAHWGHRNNATAAVDDDGSVTIVVSERRPPDRHVANWLPLRGHTVGNAQFRLSRCDAPMPELAGSVVPIDDLSR